jgi:arylsulfatase A-like enzyme
MKIQFNNPKIFILIIIVSSILGCGSKHSNKKNVAIDKTISVPSHGKQNILFIAIDDLRPLINVYDASQMITPHLDMLASNSIKFNNAFTNIAVCGASRASLMTGIRPSQARFTGYSTRASEDVPTAISLNQIFKENGYETISYGKIYHHSDDFKQHWSEIDEGQIQSDYQNPVSIQRKKNALKGEYGNKGVAFEYADVNDDAYTDGKITKKAINTMKRLTAENKPFFMAVGYVSPHLPFIQPKKYWDLYNHEDIQLAENQEQPKNSPDIAVSSQHFGSELRNSYLDIPAEGPLGKELSRNLIHGYYASVSYMDALIGQLVASLDTIGIGDNTTIILWSDHGYFLGEHGFWTKHSTLYEAVKIPFMISSPNYDKNKITESFTELIDVYPTLCDIANIEAPEYLHGKSLIPVLKEPSKNLKTEVYTRYKEGEAVIDKDYSYTEFYEDDTYVGNMLYNLNKDPKQNIDIAKDANNKALVKTYSKKLSVMRKEVNKNPI